jgi:hypothetical protein
MLLVLVPFIPGPMPRCHLLVTTGTVLHAAPDAFMCCCAIGHAVKADTTRFGVADIGASTA